MIQHTVEEELAQESAPLSPPVLWETNDVAKHLGISYAWVHQLVTARKLKPITKTLRGVRLFWPPDVERFRKAREDK